LGLIEIAAAGENRFAFEHLTENAPVTIRNERERSVAKRANLPNSPHVNRRCIPTKLK
jgi:hypothetical protein